MRLIVDRQDELVAPRGGAGHVAECGNCDRGLPPGNKLIPVETGQRLNYSGSAQTGTETGLEERRDDQQLILTTSPVSRSLLLHEVCERSFAGRLTIEVSI